MFPGKTSHPTQPPPWPSPANPLIHGEGGKGRSGGGSMRPTHNTAQSVVRPNPHHPFLSYLPRSPSPTLPSLLKDTPGKQKRPSSLSRPLPFPASCPSLHAGHHHTVHHTFTPLVITIISTIIIQPLTPYSFASFVSETFINIASSSSSILQQ